MRHDEDAIHRAILQYLMVALPARAVTPWHTPNGERREARAGARLKALGARRGVSDLLWYLDGRLFALEIKPPGGRPTKEQREFGAAVEANGGRFGVARSVEDACRLCREWGVPLRAHPSDLREKGGRDGW